MAAYLDIGLIDSPGATSGSAKAIPAFDELRGIPLHRTQDGGMCKVQSAFRHHLDQIAEAELITQIPAHTQDAHLAVEVPPSKQFLNAIQFAHRWSSTLQEPKVPDGPRPFAPKPLVEGHRSVLKRIYSCEAYYERVKIYLSRTYSKNEEERSRQRWLTRGNLRAFVTSIFRRGVFGRHRWSYWRFLLTAATHYRHCIGPAMTLADMGYHFQVMTSRLSDTVSHPVLPAAESQIQVHRTGRNGP